MKLIEYIKTQNNHIYGEKLKSIIPLLHEFVEFSKSNINYIDKYKITKNLSYNNGIMTNLDEITIKVKNPKLSNTIYINSIGIENGELFIEGTQNSFI